MKKVAIITGAVGVLGAATCRKLADAEFVVAAADRDVTAAQSLAAELPGGGHIGIEVDVSSEESVSNLFNLTESVCGKVSVIITFAGVLLMSPGQRPGLAGSTVEEWQKTFDVNALGTFLCVREFARRRTENPLPYGRIVTVSSIAAQIGSASSSTAYAASKGAVISLTKSAARELAPMGITVNSIAPGVFESAIMRKAVPEQAEQKVMQQIPVGRFGMPNEIASTAAFLVSEDAGYITGTVVAVNGGFRI